MSATFALVVAPANDKYVVRAVLAGLLVTALLFWLLSPTDGFSAGMSLRVLTFNGGLVDDYAIWRSS